RSDWKYQPWWPRKVVPNIGAIVPRHIHCAEMTNFAPGYARLRSMELRELAAYARQIRPKLSAHVFAPAHSRLLWLPVHALVIAAGAWLIGADVVPGYAWPLLSIVIGCSMAGVTFLGHETMHGQIVRGRWLIRVVGWLCFLPFTLSPRLWSAWHNRVHH